MIKLTKEQSLELYKVTGPASSIELDIPTDCSELIDICIVIATSFTVTLSLLLVCLL